MARSGITREQIIEAAGALAKAGKNPTIAAVRSYLGTGSPNTIAPILAAWRQENPQPIAATPPVPKAVETALLQTWAVIWSAAQSELADEREVLRATSAQDQAEILAEIERLDAEIEQVRSAEQAASRALSYERQAHSQTKAEAQEARALADERNGYIQAERQARILAEQAVTDLRIEVATLTERVAQLQINQSKETSDTDLSESSTPDTDLEARIAEVVDCVRKIADAGGIIDSIALRSAIERAEKHVPSQSNEQIWTALRELQDREDTAAEIAKRSQTSAGSVRQYCAHLAAAGIVEIAGANPRFYRLLRGTGPVAPRVYYERSTANRIFDPNTHQILRIGIE